MCYFPASRHPSSVIFPFCFHAARMASLKPTQLILKPLTYEIPGFRQESPFLGREWLFPELNNCFTKDQSSGEKYRGVALLGDIGMGKSFAVGRIVALSTLSAFLVNSASMNRRSSGVTFDWACINCIQ